MRGFVMYRIGYIFINGQNVVNTCKCTNGGSGDFAVSFTGRIDTTNLSRIVTMARNNNREIVKDFMGNFNYRDNEGNEVIRSMLGNVVYKDNNGNTINSDFMGNVNFRDNEGNTINSDHMGNVVFTDNRGNLARKDFIGNVDYTDDVNRITNVNDACRHYGSNVVINNGNQNPTGTNDYWAQIADRWMQWGRQFKGKMEDWKKRLDQKVDLKVKGK